MDDSIEIHLRDIGRVLVDAWTRELAGIDSVTISCGDIFSTKTGLIKPGEPIEVTADAIVSPANSFGTYQFGEGAANDEHELLR